MHQGLKQHQVVGREEPKQEWYEKVQTTKCEVIGLLAVEKEKKRKLER